MLQARHNHAKKHFAGRELNRDTYTATAVGGCAPGALVGQGLIYTSAGSCRLLRGRLFGEFPDWQEVGCVLDWCRIGSGKRTGSVVLSWQTLGDGLVKWPDSHQGSE